MVAVAPSSAAHTLALEKLHHFLSALTPKGLTFALGFSVDAQDHPMPEPGCRVSSLGSQS